MFWGTPEKRALLGDSWRLYRPAIDEIRLCCLVADHKAPPIHKNHAMPIMSNIIATHKSNPTHLHAMRNTDFPSGCLNTWMQSAAPHAHIKNIASIKQYQPIG